jgi:hypothetical protein
MVLVCELDGEECLSRRAGEILDYSTGIAIDTP